MEAIVASTLVAIMLLGTLALISRDTRLSRTILRTGNVEIMAQEMLFQIERHLANAHGESPMAIVTQQLDSGMTARLVVDSTLGFPDRGMLVLDRGEPTEERISYGGLGIDQLSFNQLVRGEQCTADVTHASGKELLWCGLAEPLDEQEHPAPGTWDGIVMLASGPVYTRGDGTGFSYRVPVDPDGGTNYLDGDDVKWGSTIGGVDLLDGRSTLYFVARTTFAEEETKTDINGDGDVEDVFDVGQIRRRRWNALTPADPTEDVGLGPTAIIQERCNWGGDLDSDGFADPIFLWDRARRRLYIRLFLLGKAAGEPVLRRVESTLFLRNAMELELGS